MMLALAALLAVAPPPQDSTYGCVVCHADKRRSFAQGVHAERGIRCHDCHGGDPSGLEVRTAHRGDFLGAPGKVRTVAVCTRCHADADQMRQYGLPADQLAELRTSRHGELLFARGDTNGPTCTDCHNAHVILPPEDARSWVNPVNIPATCGRCHDDAALMDRYGLPHDQTERYRAGAHGVAIFDDQNFAAPTCVGCHGSHAALPPRVTEVTHVCQRCHVLLGRELARGPHGVPSRDGRLPGCLGCHSNHGTERVAPSAIAALCGRCHADDQDATAVGGELQEEVIRAAQDLRLAADAIDALVAAGRSVTDTRLRYRTAQTAHAQIALVQHSLDLEQLQDLTRRVGSVSRDIRGAAEVAAEQQWEHKLVLIPVWFLTLAAVLAAGFKLAALSRRGA